MSARRTSLWRLLLVASAVAFATPLAGCSTILGIGDLPAGPNGDAGSNSDAGSSGAATATCSGPNGAQNLSQCGNGVCVLGACSKGCGSDAECPTNWRCLYLDKMPGGPPGSPYGCVDDVRAKCASSTRQPAGVGCPADECAPDGSCRTRCAGGAQFVACESDQTCAVDNFCHGTDSSHDSTAAESSAETANVTVINVPTCSCPNGFPSCAACPGARGTTVDAGNVFWGDYLGDVLRCAVDGCRAAPTQIAAGDAMNPGFGASPFTFAGDVYWQGKAAVLTAGVALPVVYMCPGGTCSNSTSVPGSSQLAGVGNGGLYFIGSGISVCPTTGCGANEKDQKVIVPGTVYMSTTNVDISLAAFDSQNAYWYDSGSAQDVAMCPLAGCTTPNVLAGSQQSVKALAIDATSVYWSRLTDGATVQDRNFDIVKCALGGCAGNPTVLATGQWDPMALVVDSSNVYWITADRDVRSCSISGCNSIPSLVASLKSVDPTLAQDSISGIALDASYVYWVAGHGLVARVPKPM